MLKKLDFNTVFKEESNEIELQDIKGFLESQGIPQDALDWLPINDVELLALSNEAKLRAADNAALYYQSLLDLIIPKLPPQ